MTCAICSNSKTEDAHVRPRESFSDNDDDRYKNIIPLCPNHHTAFDEGKIGICDDGCSFLIFDEGKIEKVKSNYNLKRIKPEYINYKNEECVEKVRFHLGIIPGMKYGKL